jgi:XTP/dITP diphosphohydrolase
MKLILATYNEGKVREVKKIMKELEILSLKEIGFDEEIVEDKETFLGNAMNKAAFVHDRLKDRFQDFFVLADDSGLEVKALGGKPGVFSSRYAGENATDEQNIEKLLFEMKDIPFENRDANYTCAMVLIYPDSSFITSIGRCNGKIAFQPKGKNGFGYDPVFLTEESNYKLTMAELSEDEKNKISHRRKALEGILNGYRGNKI